MLKSRGVELLMCLSGLRAGLRKCGLQLGNLTAQLLRLARMLKSRGVKLLMCLSGLRAGLRECSLQLGNFATKNGCVLALTLGLLELPNSVGERSLSLLYFASQCYCGFALLQQPCNVVQLDTSVRERQSR